MLDSLRSIIPSSQILSKKDDLTYYTKDFSYAPSVFPKAVVFAEKSNDVGIVLKWANANKIPVTVRGAGTGKSGGSIPLPNGIVLSMERMTTIKEIDTKNKMVVTEPGVILKDLQAKCLKEELWIPLDPSSLDKCTIGGMVTENAGGPRALKYGVTGDYVYGMQGFFGDGSPFKFGGKLYKDVAGYDLKRLLIGSEGTLGVLTEITLKCILPVKEEIGIWLTFETLEDGVSFVREIARSNVQPATAEFMQKECIEAVANHCNLHGDWGDENSHVFITLDGNNKSDLLEQAQKITANQANLSNVIIANDTETLEKLWKIRREISESLSGVSKHKVSEDITVPPHAISEFMSKLSDLDKGSLYSFIGYGHLGDGNIHVNILNTSQDEVNWEKDFPKLIDEVMTLCLSCGGTPTGEHGIGLTKKSYVTAFFQTHEIDLMKKIKKLFDPSNILNPNKIF
ncbi:glycolate oxidase subunit GlcD [Candidatus Marinamargulisbacteria bacterium SCGC AAA071-K20]|nr:glycolate oxidase subunit GlcD [Candidatus Marinamargulisbacteria bacterium SCGC AAA071-K20]